MVYASAMVAITSTAKKVFVRNVKTNVQHVILHLAAYHALQALICKMTALVLVKRVLTSILKSVNALPARRIAKDVSVLTSALPVLMVTTCKATSHVP